MKQDAITKGAANEVWHQCGAFSLEATDLMRCILLLLLLNHCNGLRELAIALMKQFDFL